MSLLIINTLPESEPLVRQAIDALATKEPSLKVINTESMNISPCIGCNFCWLKTPGVCAIKDDYEQILRAYLEYDDVVFISGTALGFINYKMKNVIDRVLPLFTMHTFFKDGQMRHVPRYDKKWRFGLLYLGEADKEYLETWLERFAINMLSTSIGVFEINDIEEAIKCV